MGNAYISNQILIGLLKEYGIKKLVLSPGTRNIPFVSEVETDSYFECYSVVDERNAAFFALGLQQQCGEAVALACTSGTAVSNYLSGMTEAFYSHAPLVAITFDRDPYTLNQLETQKIDQTAVFTSVTKKAVSLPIIKDREDVWYCQRLVNEALIELQQGEPGPVHINLPLSGDTNALNQKFMDDALNNKIKRIDYYAGDNNDWTAAVQQLKKAKRVLMVLGQDCERDKETAKYLREFLHKYRIPALGDNMCNFRCEERIMAEGLIKALNGKTITPLLPEIVITVGNNFQERIKDLLKAHQGEFEHWSVNRAGSVRDVFKSQKAIFATNTKEFAFRFTQAGEIEDVEEREAYLNQWKKYESVIKLPEMPWNNFYVAQEFSKVIPENAILHLAILNSTRLMQFFDLPESISVYGNVNSFGIDGCLPTFMGQAAATTQPAFIVIGDLSFFYGMNALGIKSVKNNVRVLLLNNGGAAEFHIQPDSDSRPTIDLHIGCAHSRTAKGWAESLGYRYLKAHDKSTLKTALEEFVKIDSAQPMLLEVFTDMKTDGQFLLSVYRHLEKCISDLEE